MVRIIVAGELPREEHNAPLHLFSASPVLVGFGSDAYRLRSERTSGLLRQLFQQYQGEDLGMPFTWADFDQWYIKEHFPELTPEQRREILRTLPKEELLAVLSTVDVQEHPAQRVPDRPVATRKAGRAKHKTRKSI